MPFAILEVLDDVAPGVGATRIDFYGQQVITNDSNPTVRVALEGAQPGETLRLTVGSTPILRVLTAEDLARGWADIATPTLDQGYRSVLAELVRADGSVLRAVNGQIFVGADTAAPGRPTITGAADDAGAQTGAVANGGSTDDTTPTLQISFDTERPPPTQGSPGHNPFPPTTLAWGRLDILADGQVIKSLVPPSQSPAVVQLGELATGTHTLTARLTDGVGNVGATSEPFHITVSAVAGGGQVITSPGPGSTLSGGAGNDTLNASQGPDVLTGGGGADTFVFQALPWNAGRITDFAVGADRLDLSAIFQASGYAGSDPVADGRMRLEADGAGGTRLYFDRDAPGAGEWPFLITTLSGVPTAGLTWAQLAGGGPAPPPTSPPPAGGGQVINSPGPGSTLTGGSGDDTLNASQGPDVLTGGGGGDVFVFQALPWSAGRITDFALGTDRLDLSAIFQGSGYAGSDPVADGRMRFEADGAGGARVYFDRDAPNAGDWPFLIATLNGVGPDGLTWAKLAGGSSSAPPPPPPASGEGQVLTAQQPGDTLSGGAGNDTLNASRGADVLTGAGGADRFVFADAPWSAGRITDFTRSVDKIDLRGILDDAGYAGSDPFADGYLFLQTIDGGVRLVVDMDGPSQQGDWPITVTTLTGVSSLSTSDFIFQ